MAPGDADEFNSKVISEFRANGGRVGGQLADTPLLLLHHIGAKSGVERVTPVAYSRQHDGRLVIAASNGGSRTHPAWYHNLKADPRVHVELGTQILTMLAHVLEGAARASLWPELVEASPTIGRFQADVARRIPLLVLTREDSAPLRR